MRIHFFTIFLFSIFAFIDSNRTAFAITPGKTYPNAKSSEKYNGVNGLAAPDTKELEDDGAYTDSSGFNRIQLEKDCAEKDCLCGIENVSIAKKWKTVRITKF